MILQVFWVLVLLEYFFHKEVLAYEATWESLDSRPLPQWYDQAKFGIFIHWGVFSVPSFKGEWMWHHWGGNPDIQEFIKKTERSNFAYADYAHRFDAALYDPAHWTSIFAQSGAQYVVLTSKHHEGFCNWDSRSIPATWLWNSMEVGPRRDLVGALAKEVKQATSNHTQKPLRFGLYHSLYEWYNALYLADARSNFTTNQFVQLKTMPELYDIVKKYEPELIWSDGDWDAHSDYWDSKKFLAWYATNSSVAETAIWNDRWGKDAECKHGSFLTCADRYLPDKIVHHKWENALTVTKESWGYDRSLTFEAYYSAEYLVRTLIQTVAYNGNMLLNVGPRADGTLDPVFEERLLEIGEWLGINGEAIYETKPWKIAQHEETNNIFYTTSQRDEEYVLYALFSDWPDDNLLHLASPLSTEKTTARLLGMNQTKSGRWQGLELLSERSGSEGMTVALPTLTPGKAPCQYAWVVAITGIDNFEPGQRVTSSRAATERKEQMSH